MAHIVIVGGGLAAGSAAETLREEGYDGDVTIVTAEPHPPYQRPPLSKGYLAGEEGRDAVILHPADWYADRGIQLHMSTEALALYPAAHRIETTGPDLAYDSLLLATGASPRRLPIDGHDLAGVHSLRSLDDSDALADRLRAGGQRLVLIGSGWIGMEVAATARTLGNDVTILERDQVPLALAVGSRMGEVFRSLHEVHGVDLRTSVQVERIVGNGRVDGVVVDGETVTADLVLIGVGAIPNTYLATAAGIAVDNGILTDASLRTSAPDVYAAGDVANAYHPVIQRHLRSEHWANALNAGPIAARVMMGGDAVHDGIPYFYTDQFDLGMELSGYPPLMAAAELVVRGDVDAREFVAFWVDGGRVVGGMNVNVWDVQDDIQALIRSGERVSVRGADRRGHAARDGCWGEPGSTTGSAALGSVAPHRGDGDRQPHARLVLRSRFHLRARRRGRRRTRGRGGGRRHRGCRRGEVRAGSCRARRRGDRARGARGARARAAGAGERGYVLSGGGARRDRRGCDDHQRHDRTGRPCHGRRGRCRRRDDRHRAQPSDCRARSTRSPSTKTSCTRSRSS